MNPYYVAPKGEQQGPLTLAQLQLMLDAGQLQTTDLCWREGMGDWQAIHAALPALSAPPRQALPSHEHNPYAPPGASLNAVSRLKAIGEYGGLGRASYFGLSILLSIVVGILAALVEGSEVLADENPFLAPPLLAVCPVLGLWLVSLRMKNTGTTRWLLLLLLVPGVNVLFAVATCLYLVIAPEGYADTRTLDGGGRLMVWILGLWLGAMLLLLAFAMVSPFIFR